MATGAERERVPVLPRAEEVRETIRAMEKGLALLRGLAVALARVERKGGARAIAADVIGERLALVG
jgi:hypothetical protein